LKEPKRWVNAVPKSIRGEVARHYAASVMHLDDAVGRILSALEETGQRKNTLFVFTSDNGGSTAENNDLKYPDDNCPNGKLPGNNLPFRGRKGTMHEGGTRVPTIVSWPGRIRAGVNATPVFVPDWMPTFCALAGYKAERDLKWDGVDLTGLLLGGEALPARDIYIAGPRWRATSLRSGDWKLIVNGSKPKQSIELYNIAADPSETSNLAKRDAARVADLMMRLERAAAADRDAVVKN